MKACPTCHVAYANHFAICPRDATRLIEAGESTAPPEDLHPALKFLKTRASLKKTCPQCHGVYPGDFSVCTHDGTGLNWLVRWTAGDLVKAKGVCSMRDASLPVTSREYRLLACVEENDSCLEFKALELDSGRECTLVTPMVHPAPDLNDAWMTKGFVAFAQFVIEWTTHRHENLLEIESLAQMDDGRLFFVLDFEDGRKLTEVIRQEAPIPPLRACALARQIASGLGALHAGGMVHGGAVPKNILVTGRPGAERIKLLPLGLRKLRSAYCIVIMGHEAPTSGCILGIDRDYVPEQIRGKEPDARADLYALGTILYEMLTADYPIKGAVKPARITDYVTAVLKEPPTPFAAARPGLNLPKKLEALVMRCLEKDPNLRPANAQELILEIQQVEAEIQRPAAPHPSPAVVTPASSPAKDSKVPIASPGSGAPRAKLGPWAEGQIIRGKYRVLHWLGMGDLGIGYKALQLKPEIMLVIQVAYDERREISQQVARERVKLQHPNVVSAVEVDEAEDGRPYMVMEWVEGRSLEQVMQQEGPLAPLRVCAIARQVAAGLGAAHALGVVHGDVSPLYVTVLQDPAGEKVKLLGFERSYLHAAIEAKSPNDAELGVWQPPAYASPEQLRGTRLSDLDGRSDLFSLGVILYQMLTGEKPFSGKNATAVVYTTLTQQPKPVRMVRPDLAIPDSLTNLVMRCLEKDRNLRPASAQEMIQEIERVESELKQPPPGELSPEVLRHTPEPQGGDFAGAGSNELEQKQSTEPPKDLHPALKFLKTPVTLKKTCPQCHEVYPANLYACTNDGLGLDRLDLAIVGNLIKAKSDCSMRGEDASLSISGREYRLLARVDEERSYVVFEALELDSGRERTLVTPRMDDIMAPQDDVATEAFEAFAQGVIEWTTHRHENLLEIVGLAQMDDGYPFFVLDLEEGRRLSEVIRQEAPLPPWHACALARQIASALGALHAGAMIHGGATPKNILVTAGPGAERIKVLPLGLRKLEDAWYILNQALGADSLWLVLGDYRYLAPEQTMRGKPDARADLYKLGVVLYEMLTGSRPFRGAGREGYFKAPFNEPPIPIAVAQPELKVPMKLEALVMRLLERDPSRRPANVQEVINEITQVEEDLRRAAKTPAPMPKGAPAPSASTGGPAYVPKPDEWPPGAIVRDKYRILTKLGQGGTGVVYKVLHLAFEDLRTLQVFRPSLFHDEASRKTFKRELMRTCQLRHPNAMRVDDVDETEDGWPFLVTEFLVGRNLRALLNSESPLAPKRVCKIIKQAASALAAGHQLGLLHGNVKPEQFLLLDSPAGEVVKLMNYGDVHILAGLTPGYVIGNPRYMAPEVIMGKPRNEMDGRMDLYPLGLVMYEMLTADFPMRASTVWEIINARLRQPPIPIGAVHPELNIPEDLAALTLRLLEKDPDQRPASARELVRELEQIEEQL
jgi:serine/threonine protein kinase